MNKQQIEIYRLETIIYKLLNLIGITENEEKTVNKILGKTN